MSAEAKILPFITKAPVVTDVELMEACAAGDPRALSTLFERHQRAVQRFVARALKLSPADIEDVLQTTFLEVYRSAGRFEGRSSVSSFILGIALNTGRGHIRKNVRRQRLAEVVAHEPQKAPRTPEMNTDRRQKVERLQAAMDNLSEPLRVVFVMCDVEGQRGTEVAQALGLREGTVYRRLHEARKALRHALASEEKR